MKTLEQFCKQNEPKRRMSKLDSYYDEITELYDRGYQIEQIRDFLKSQKIDISVRGIRKYLKSRKTIQVKTSQGAQITNEPTTRSSVTQSFIDKYKKK